MKDIGIVGVPYSGKSTLFTALTHAGAIGGRANQAVVDVPDPRPARLAELEGSKRAVLAQVRFVDVPGGTSSAHGIGALREMDALCVVLRAFGPDPDAARELAEVRADLILADLQVVESSLTKATKRARGKPTDEVAVLERAQAALSEETPLREAGFEEVERKLLSPLAPLTLKPWVPVANLEEGTGIPEGLPPDTVGVWAEIEAEVAELDEADARALLEEFGVHEPGLDDVVHACYRALDLITFLTANEDEARAWELRRGAKAPEAAGTVHSDMERGFIRADVIRFDDLVDCGGFEQARHLGRLRVEGKDYEVQEGDILHVRFSV